jgi:hypothetical protein
MSQLCCKAGDLRIPSFGVVKPAPCVAPLRGGGSSRVLSVAGGLCVLHSHNLMKRFALLVAQHADAFTALLRVCFEGFDNRATRHAAWRVLADRVFAHATRAL